MAKRSVPPSPPKLQDVKDDTGAYLPREKPGVTPAPGTLDDILKRQITALDRVTRQLTAKITAGDLTKAEIDSLATCIEVTMKLKSKEKELLDTLSDEVLESLAEGE